MGWGPALLRCLANVCGGHSAAARTPAASEHDPEFEVVKPVFRLDELDKADTRPEDLIANLGMQAAPPGAADPLAVTSIDFNKNSSRLMVFVPASDAPPGSFDPHLGGCGNSASLVKWADANGFATALFFAQALEKDPAKTWETVLKGSPARFVVVVVGNNMMPSVEVALTPMHALLFSRFRVVCTVPGRNGSHGAGYSQSLPQDLKKHFSTALLQLPIELWSPASDAKAAHQNLLQQVISRQERLDGAELKKYSGFQNLKENDQPGLKRLGVDERVAKLDRDRGNDELARLCKAHCDDEEEPGMD